MTGAKKIKKEILIKGDKLVDLKKLLEIKQKKADDKKLIVK